MPTRRNARVITHAGPRRDRGARTKGPSVRQSDNALEPVFCDFPRHLRADKSALGIESGTSARAFGLYTARVTLRNGRSLRICGESCVNLDLLQASSRRREENARTLRAVFLRRAFLSGVLGPT
jgi:hypothetical protein